uniref:NADH-ubiquinone oxidoreductase chain 2 n=1 Tax=Pituna poranga TaxID=61829 RepID=Q9TD12_9TELE|nr:NADH dehydrogenase subunit II [Pituna poranga]
MNPYILTILAISLVLGTLLATTTSHWIMVWVGLEINTFTILPLMTQKYSPRAIEAAVKYFIIQTAATMIILFATILNAWMAGDWSIKQMNYPPSLMMVTMSLVLKMGLAPLHAWFPEVMQGLTLELGLILSTWQKLAPFSILLQLTIYNSTLITSLGLLSILMGGWGGLNQTQIRKILSYSSIANLGWMLLISQYLPSMAFMTFLIYSILTFSMFIMLWLNQSTTINTLSTSWFKTPALLFMVPLILLSLGGLPPLTGFIPKWMILFELTKQNLTFFATTAALANLMSLFFYLRMSYAMALTSSPNFIPMTLSWRIKTLSFTAPLGISTGISLYTLPMTPAIMIMIP